MVFEYVTRMPPDGGDAQEMLEIADCGIRIPVTPAVGAMVFSVYAQADAVRQIVINIGNGTKTVTVGTAWQRIEYALDGSDDVYITASGSTPVYLYKAQMETGNSATGWKPNPDDIEQDIDDARDLANNAQNDANDARDRADSVYTQVNATEQNLGKWFDFDDQRGLVIRAYDLDEMRPTGKWENVISEDSYQINNINYGTVFEAYKDRVRPTKLEFARHNLSIVMKSDGRGGVVFVKG